MSKKKRRAGSTRDAPITPPALCSLNAFEVLCGDGYTRLSACPEVRMCVDVYADLISNMTLYLMRNTERGDVRVRNGLSRRMDIEPHPLMTRKAWMSNLVNVLLLEGDGNQITIPRFDQEGWIESLEPCAPSQVSLVSDPPDGYHILYRGRWYEPDEVLHFRLNPDPEAPWRGRGYRAQIKEVAAALKQANATKCALMRSPAPSLIVKVDGLTAEFANKEGRESLRKQYIDASENGMPWFIPSEAFSVETVKPLTLNDLAIAKNLELDKRTIAGILGVPAFLLGVGEFKAEEFNNFINTRVQSIAKVIEQELTRQTLFSPDLYWKFNPRSLYAYSMESIISAGGAMVDRMAMSRNEWRDWVGLQPDERMDELLALENYVPVARLGDQKKLKGGTESDDEEQDQ